jgi:hypothetical protein
MLMKIYLVLTMMVLLLSKMRGWLAAVADVDTNAGFFNIK